MQKWPYVLLENDGFCQINMMIDKLDLRTSQFLAHPFRRKWPAMEMDGNPWMASLNKFPHAAMTIGGWPKVVPGGS